MNYRKDTPSLRAMPQNEIDILLPTNVGYTALNAPCYMYGAKCIVISADAGIAIEGLRHWRLVIQQVPNEL